MEKRKIKLIFSNASEFEGYSCSPQSEGVFPAVFCNDMIGYEDIIFDSRFFGKLVVMSYPLIGNCGISSWHMEKRPFVGAIAARELSDETDPERGSEKICDALDVLGVAAVDGLDTRKIVRMMRSESGLTATIADENEGFCDVKHRFDNFCEDSKPMTSCADSGARKYSSADSKINIAAIDCSFDHDISKDIWNMGASVTVFDPGVTAAEIENGGFDALIITDGPGSGDELADEVSKMPPMPMLAVGAGALIALKGAFEGANLIARASFCVNRPIRELKDGKIFISSKFCGYDVDERSILDAGFVVAMRDVIDESAAAFESADGAVIAMLATPPKDKLGDILKNFIDKLNGEKIDA